MTYVGPWSGWSHHQHLPMALRHVGQILVKMGETGIVNNDRTRAVTRRSPRRWTFTAAVWRMHHCSNAAGTSREKAYTVQRIEGRDDNPTGGAAKRVRWYGRLLRDWDAPIPGAGIRGQIVMVLLSQPWGSFHAEWDADGFSSMGQDAKVFTFFSPSARGANDPADQKHKYTDTG